MFYIIKHTETYMPRIIVLQTGHLELNSNAYYKHLKQNVCPQGVQHGKTVVSMHTGQAN